MVAPVTSGYYYESDKPGRYEYRSWSRQKRPYTLPLPYISLKKYVDEFYAPGSEGYIPSAAGVGSDAPSAHLTRARNAAYKQFISKCGDTASLGVSLAEANQSVNMISARAKQLYDFGRALRKGEFERAAKILGLEKPPRRLGNKKRSAKGFANNYLEFHFGWSPLIQDIGAAIKVLGNDFPHSTVKGSGGENGSSRTYVNNTLYLRTTNLSVRVAAKVGVSNPNLLLANQLGFVNPLSVAWELVPLSFVVDWFASVGDYLNSFTDKLGLTIVDPYTSIFTRCNGSTTWLPSGLNGSVGQHQEDHTISLVRETGITGPTLVLKPFKGFSVRRGAAAISLLVQSMK